MADYVKRPTIYKRVQYDGDQAHFLADLQAETNSWWQWATYSGDGSTVLLRYSSNTQAPGFLEVPVGQFVVFRDGPDELPYVDWDGSSVVPAP